MGGAKQEQGGCEWVVHTRIEAATPGHGAHMRDNQQANPRRRQSPSRSLLHNTDQCGKEPPNNNNNNNNNNDSGSGRSNHTPVDVKAVLTGRKHHTEGLRGTRGWCLVSQHTRQHGLHGLRGGCRRGTALPLARRGLGRRACPTRPTGAIRTSSPCCRCRGGGRGGGGGGRGGG